MQEVQRCLLVFLMQQLKFIKVCEFLGFNIGTKVSRDAEKAVSSRGQRAQNSLKMVVFRIYNIL